MANYLPSSTRAVLEACSQLLNMWILCLDVGLDPKCVRSKVKS